LAAEIYASRLPSGGTKDQGLAVAKAVFEAIARDIKDSFSVKPEY
jgi:hypothetical protein